MDRKAFLTSSTPKLYIRYANSKMPINGKNFFAYLNICLFTELEIKSFVFYLCVKKIKKEEKRFNSAETLVDS